MSRPAQRQNRRKLPETFLSDVSPALGLQTLGKKQHFLQAPKHHGLPQPWGKLRKRGAGAGGNAFEAKLSPKKPLKMAVVTPFKHLTFQDDFPLASLPLLGYAVHKPDIENDQISKDYVFKLVLY